MFLGAVLAQACFIATVLVAGHTASPGPAFSPASPTRRSQVPTQGRIRPTGSVDTGRLKVVRRRFLINFTASSDTRRCAGKSRFLGPCGGWNTLQRDAYIARSQSLPFSMFLTDKSPIFLSTHAHRLRGLDLIIQTSELRALSFQSSEGMLEAVVITEVANPKFLTLVVDVEDLRPQQTVLFDRPILHLKALAISSMTAWPMNHYPNLTHLYLSLWHSRHAV
ncbi:hypothetical protein C8Q74DRAFT_1294068 [Fomes fomentarius]|nr:hypothetical protein C8Q74DRAFT_1294068 [Fomes fomentarius]